MKNILLALLLILGASTLPAMGMESMSQEILRHLPPGHYKGYVGAEKFFCEVRVDNLARGFRIEVQTDQFPQPVVFPYYFTENFYLSQDPAQYYEGNIVHYSTAYRPSAKSLDVLAGLSLKLNQEGQVISVSVSDTRGSRSMSVRSCILD